MVGRSRMRKEPGKTALELGTVTHFCNPSYPPEAEIRRIIV
jgi:hypothetical protein